MSSIPDITLVVGTDAKYFPQLKTSWRTWLLNRREMWGWPMILFYDRAQLSHDEMADFRDCELRHPLCQLIAWPPLHVEHTRYESQRERMLSGHIHVPAMYVKTQFHMKVDCDTVAGPNEKWLGPEWFAPREDRQPPAWIAPHWGYTKGIGFLSRLDDWGDSVPLLAAKPRLNIPANPDQKRVPHSRMCSWLSFYLTEFTRTVAAMCNASIGPCRLPIPSQDTVAWYVAERLGLHRKVANMKRKNWSNHPKFHNLKAKADEILGVQVANA